MANGIVDTYTLTVLGNVTGSDLNTRIGAAPLDTQTLFDWGLRLVSDITGLSGSAVTRTITLSQVPTTAGTLTAASGAGDTSGGPIVSTTVTAAGIDYVREPLLAVTGSGNGAKLRAQLGVVGITLNSGGAGYSASAQVVATGGQLAAGGAQATFTTTVTVGVISVAVLTAGGPYNVPPTLSIIDGGVGSGFDAVARLGLTGAQITAPGNGYGAFGAATTVTVTPFFQAMAPGHATASVAESTISGFMQMVLQQASRSPVTYVTTVI